MSPSDERSQRPTLPPIRDLFRDELSNPSYESPQAILARLRVSDDHDYHGRHSPRPSEPSSSKNFQHPTHRSRGMPSHSHTLPPGHYSPAQPSSSHAYEKSSLHRSQSYSHEEYHHRSYQHVHHHSVAQTRSPSNRDTVGMVGYDARGGLPLHDPRYTLSPAYPPPMSSNARTQSMSVDHRNYPWPISTRVDQPHHPEDDDRTPTARYSGHPQHPFRYPPQDPLPPNNNPANAKYECHYCGKGFNRPSSLKIHLNSHTGEKPFACPVEGCGRSFSVLSNMRRHARVHTTNAGKEKGASSDEGAHSLSNSQAGFSGPSSDSKWLQRRGSIASSTSSSSRRSRSVSSDEDEEEERPEKRSRLVPLSARR